MNTLPPRQLPVCAYDGHCYHKSTRHFQEYAHPLQYPSQPSDAASTTCDDERHETSSKRSRSEQNLNFIVHDSHEPAVEDQTVSVQETDLASPAQLLHFLTHAPHLSALVSVKSENGQNVTTLPHIDVQQNWNGVAQVLEQAYGGMGFCAEDVQCVLTAAYMLKPLNPLFAFPGWGLIGPLELALKYGQLCPSDAHSNANEKESVEELRVLLHGRNAADEVRRWRCGRFRYDPPECQTVAVHATSFPVGIKATTAAQLDADGVHLCFHRDEPSHAPGMLVEGTVRKPKFTVVNGKGWLSPYLYAWYRAKADTDSLAIAQALEKAISSISVEVKSAHCADLKKSFADSLSVQRGGLAKRRKAWVAPTYSGLGLSVPVDKTTKIGYREPNIPSGVSFANCLRDLEADFVASAASPSTADNSLEENNDSNSGSSGPVGALDSVPFSRSSSYARLQDALPLSVKTSEMLDSIFLCTDIANDEGDFGTSLELGLNCLTCILADTCVVAGKGEKAKAASEGNSDVHGGDTTPRPEKVYRPEESRIDPVLWHTYRLLDSAYMLLQRPLYRHILRCHLPVLANANRPILLDLHE